MPDLSADIAAQAVEPQSVAADGQSATARSVADMIAADQYLGNVAARRYRRRGLTYAKLLPAGALSDQGRTQGGFAGGLQ